MTPLPGLEVLLRVEQLGGYQKVEVLTWVYDVSYRNRRDWIGIYNEDEYRRYKLSEGDYEVFNIREKVQHG